MLKVSCATPVLGPAVGIMGVGVANVLAGQASKHTRKLLVDGANPRKPGFWEKPDVEDLVLDAVLGAAIFKVRESRREERSVVRVVFFLCACVCTHPPPCTTLRTSPPPGDGRTVQQPDAQQPGQAWGPRV